MKRILTLLFLLCAFASFSQTNPQYNSVRLVGSDSTSGTVTVNGTIRFNPVSGKFRFRQGGTWVGLGAGASGSSTFTGLTDGPGSFSGKTLNYFRVNAGETALEYRTPTQVRSDIAAAASAITISTTAPLSGGGDLSANRTLTIANAAADGSTKGASGFNSSSFDDNGSGIINLDATVNVKGKQDLFVSSVAMWPRVTNGSSVITQTEVSTSLFNVQTLDFDATTQEFAQMQVVLPRNWNNGTITATVYWTAASGSGGVVWGISGGAYSDDDALSTALGTAQTTTDTFITANDVHITAATSAITIAGSPADADFLAIQISRNPSDGSDTLNADAKLLGIRITFTLDSAISE